jgi:hypothetical protein
MLYIVEVIVDVKNLTYELSQMRRWLDHMQCETVGFREISGTNVCRVDFESEEEARAFARAFSGQILYLTAA